MNNYFYENTGSYFRSGAFDKITINLKPAEFKYIPFKEACVKRAETIINELGDFDFAMSGGIWSHICYMSILEAGYKPPVKIFKLPNNLNSYDIEVAKELATHVGADFVISEINLKDDTIGTYLNTAKKYQIYSFTDAMMARLAEMNKKNLLITDAITFKRNVEPGWRLIIDESRDLYHFRFNELNYYKIIGSFFTGSTDVLYSFMKIPMVEDIMTDKIKNKLSTTTSIKKIFESAGYQLPNKPYYHISFLELLPEFNRKISSVIVNNSGLKKRNLTIKYNDLYKSLDSEGMNCSFI